MRITRRAITKSIIKIELDWKFVMTPEMIHNVQEEYR